MVARAALSSSSGGQQLIRPHVSQEGLEVAISVVAQVRDLTADEDAALVEALDGSGARLNQPLALITRRWADHASQ